MQDVAGHHILAPSHPPIPIPLTINRNLSCCVRTGINKWRTGRAIDRAFTFAVTWGLCSGSSDDVCAHFEENLRRAVVQPRSKSIEDSLLMKLVAAAPWADSAALTTRLRTFSPPPRG